MTSRKTATFEITMDDIFKDYDNMGHLIRNGEYDDMGNFLVFDKIPDSYGYINISIANITIDSLIFSVALNILACNVDILDYDIVCEINGFRITGSDLYGKTVIPFDDIKGAERIHVYMTDAYKTDTVRMRLADRDTDPFVEYCYERRLIPTPSYCQDNEFVCESERLATAMRIIARLLAAAISA